MIGTVWVEGHEFVAPTGKLSMPHSDYFPFGVENWVELHEIARKLWISERDGNVCQISGEFGEVHEIVARGGMGLKALAPWNMITVTRANHSLLHAGKSKIIKFDPLDSKDGLLVNMNDRLMQKSRIHFYNVTSPGMAVVADKHRATLEGFVKARINNMWEAAKALDWLKRNDGHAIIGCSSYNSLIAEIGLDTAFADPLRRTYFKSNELGVLESALHLHPERAEKILRQIKPEKIEFVLSEAKGLVDKRSFTDLIDENKKPRTVNMRTYFVIDGNEKRLVEAPNIQGVKGEIIVDGVVKRDIRNEVKE